MLLTKQMLEEALGSLGNPKESKGDYHYNVVTNLMNHLYENVNVYKDYQNPELVTVSLRHEEDLVDFYSRFLLLGKPAIFVPSGQVKAMLDMLQDIPKDQYRCFVEDSGIIVGFATKDLALKCKLSV